MEQNYDTRGKLAFIADQVRAAELAFQVGEFDQVTEILTSLPPFIIEFLREANQRRQ